MYWNKIINRIRNKFCEIAVSDLKQEAKNFPPMEGCP